MVPPSPFSQRALVLMSSAAGLSCLLLSLWPQDRTLSATNSMAKAQYHPSLRADDSDHGYKEARNGDRRLLGKLISNNPLLLLDPKSVGIKEHKEDLPLLGFVPSTVSTEKSLTPYVKQNPASASVVDEEQLAKFRAAWGDNRDKVNDAPPVQHSSAIIPAAANTSCHKKRAATEYVQYCSKENTQCKPRPDFEGRIIYMSMGSEDYIVMLELFVQSLLGFDVKESDIGIVCIDEGCAAHFQQNRPQVIIYRFTDEQMKERNCYKMNAEAQHNRCRVSLGKAVAILETLRAGHAVYFVDADVFFFQHPYDSMSVKNPNLDLYVHPDNQPEGNFGGILAYSSPFTIALFEHIEKTFDETFEKDQEIFNNWLLKEKNEPSNNYNFVCGDPFDWELLDQKQHPQFLYGRTVLKNLHASEVNPKTVHATCIEGSATKMFSLITLWGSPVPSYYTNTKTVSMESYGWKTKEEVDAFMKPLAYIAHVTGRAIRVNMSTGYYGKHFYAASQPYRIVSADFLLSLGIQVVEPSYWERASGNYNRIPTITRLDHFRIENSSNMAEVLFQVAGSSADEIVFTLDELHSLNSNLDIKFKRSFACNLLGMKSDKPCLKVCDGSHF